MPTLLHALNAIDEEDPRLLVHFKPVQFLVDALPAVVVKDVLLLQAVEVVAAEEVFELFVSYLLLQPLAAEHQIEDVSEVALFPVLLADLDVDSIEVEDTQTLQCLVHALGSGGSSVAVDEDDAATLLVVKHGQDVQLQFIMTSLRYRSLSQLKSV